MANDNEPEQPAKNVGDVSPFVMIATALIPLAAVAVYFLTK